MFTKNAYQCLQELHTRRQGPSTLARDGAVDTFLRSNDGHDAVRGGRYFTGNNRTAEKVIKFGMNDAVYTLNNKCNRLYIVFLFLPPHVLSFVQPIDVRIVYGISIRVLYS